SREVTVSDGERVELDELLAEKAPHRSISLLGGALGFVDQQSRREVLPAAAVVGVALRLDSALGHGLSLLADVEGSTGNTSIDLGGGAVPFHFSAVQTGAAAAWSWRLGPLTLLAGPRVAALWVQRSFALDAYSKAQSY